ncbi:LCP family protein [Brevibacterium sp. HMSC07C04]|uniref:LCP family protein n=1 Tax=Brevibacterium sp. HMSC07C04 TaxID=1581130 RepID=UPI0008A25E01|nr:LCP family protein [Brevibacterium sp. HMSC07C04]OFS26734.1 LytR family transcriptional regulator [Brevibacterium sp. HMSC07C04]
MSQRRELQYADPIRNPKRSPEYVRDRRGWWLLLCSALMPGSVQSVLGASRKFTRTALCITLGTWVLVLAAIIVGLFNRSFFLTIGTDPILLVLALVVVLAAGINWIVCLLDTMRRVRVVSLSKKTRPKFLAVGLAAVLLVGLGTAWGGVTVDAQRSLMSQLFASGKMKKPVDGRYNVALLGSDAGKGREGIRPDSLTVVSMDAKTGKSVVVGIPRNTQNVPFPNSSPLKKHFPQGYNCGDACLINAVYQEAEKHADEYKGDVPAGVQGTVEALKGVTGLEIQFYAMIDLKGFQKLIDAMGGIRLNSEVRVPISRPINPATGKHYPPKEWIEPGKNIKMDGRTALWYGRSREFATDYERMVRQRCVQEAMLRQMDPATLMTRFTKLAAAAPDVVSTDVPQRQADDFINLGMKAKSQKMLSVELTPPHVTPSHPDFTVTKQLVKDGIEKSKKEDEQAAPGLFGPAPAHASEKKPKPSSICSVPK